MKLVALLLLLFSTIAKADSCTNLGLCGFHPSLPITGNGPLFNVNQGNEALTNAVSHVGWAIAIPLLGEKIGGKKGKMIAGLSWIGISLIQETFLHAPANPGPSYPSEVRTDLVTKIVPTLVVLSF